MSYRRSLPIGLVLVASAGPLRAQELDSAQRAWIAEALATWDRICVDALDLPANDPPWMILFDDTHVWHVNGPEGGGGRRPESGVTAGTLRTDRGAWPVVGWAHGDLIALPDGKDVPVGLMTFASSHGGRPFLVASLPSIWREVVRDLTPEGLEALILGVFCHELAHTRQSTALGDRITEIGHANGLGDDFDDDIVQDRFGEREGFRAAYEEERDLLFRAAASTDPYEQRDLTDAAMQLMRERRAAYFVGAEAFYTELEDLFLAMEGTGQWVAYRAALDRGMERPAALEMIRRGGTYWSQDEGFAVFLVLDALLPTWPTHLFGPSEVSIPELLAEAAATPLPDEE